MPVKSASRASPGAITPATTKGRMRGVSRPSSDVVDSVTVQTTAVVNVTDSTAAGSGSTYWSARLRKMPATPKPNAADSRSEEHTSELQSHSDLVCRLLLEKKKQKE